jgi:ribosomal-protein-alanine N-acetyltransferase
MKKSSPARLEIRTFATEHIQALRAFLQALEISGEAAWFHPHPFTLTHLNRMAKNRSLDVYLIALWDRQVVAYGMLRGWDEGFEVPSLGLAVHPDFRKQGLGRMMMLVLHAAARLRKAPRIRLKVYKSNTGARKLYRSLGYRFSSLSQEEWLGLHDLI